MKTFASNLSWAKGRYVARSKKSAARQASARILTVALEECAAGRGESVLTLVADIERDFRDSLFEVSNG